jgi:NAD(P)-dependent dehydrogenase (short-subunit alcohol dehydrogenase family)
MVSLDVTDYASIKSALAHAETEAGHIDILINNSGVSTTQRLVDVTPEDYQFVMDTNLRGSFFVAQEAAKRMIMRAKSEPNRQHRIVNIASVAGLRVLSQIGVYCMSKAGVVQMTKAQALEWGRYGINVNAICPGYIRTEINDDYWDTDGGRKLIEMLPRRRVGEAADLDGLLLPLVAEESQFINGAVIAADDGLSVT